MVWSHIRIKASDFEAIVSFSTLLIICYEDSVWILYCVMCMSTFGCWTESLLNIVGTLQNKVLFSFNILPESVHSMD